MGCCGCSLRTSAIVAAVFGIIESFIGLIGSILLLKFGAQHYFRIKLTPLNGLPTASPFDVIDRNIPEFDGVLISGIVFNILWLVATILLIVGIIKENATLHRLWVGTTTVVLLCDVAHTITIVYVFIRTLRTTLPHNDDYGYHLFVTFLCTILFVTRGSIILWIINICLTIYTAHRATEIEKGVQPSATQVLIYGGQHTQSYTFPGQQVFVHHAGPLNGGAPPGYDCQQPPGEFENKGYRPDMPSNIGQQGIHPDQKY